MFSDGDNKTRDFSLSAVVRLWMGRVGISNGMFVMTRTPTEGFRAAGELIWKG